MTQRSINYINSFIVRLYPKLSFCQLTIETQGSQTDSTDPHAQQLAADRPFDPTLLFLWQLLLSSQLFAEPPTQVFVIVQLAPRQCIAANGVATQEKRKSDATNQRTHFFLKERFLIARHIPAIYLAQSSAPWTQGLGRILVSGNFTSHNTLVSLFIQKIIQAAYLLVSCMGFTD